VGLENAEAHVRTLQTEVDKLHVTAEELKKERLQLIDEKEDLSAKLETAKQEITQHEGDTRPLMLLPPEVSSN
jgi:peptidoglycan hydrolase CwlO-like protein